MTTPETDRAYRRGGWPVAKVPMYVGTGLVALFVLLNLVSYVVGVLTEG